MASFEEKADLAKVLEAFASCLPNYLMREFPNLILANAVNALGALRHYIEDANEPNISWNEPWVEIRIPVPGYSWNENEPFLFKTTFRDDAEMTREEQVREVAHGGYEFLHLVMLHELTNRVYIRTRGGEREAFLPPKDMERLRTLTNTERADAVDKLLQPFTLGAFSVELPDPLPDGPLDEAARSGLEAGFKNMMPGLTFAGTDATGTPFSGTVVLQFHPLVADEDAHEAYFPVVVGLQFDPLDETCAEGEEITFPDPSTWSEEDRAAFWKNLLHEDIVAKAVVTPESIKSLKTHAESLGFPGMFEARPPAETRPVPPERRGKFPLAFGRTLADAEVNDLLRHVHRVRLPARKWSTLPSWFDLRDGERDRILAEEGKKERGPSRT